MHQCTPTIRELLAIREELECLNPSDIRTKKLAAINVQLRAHSDMKMATDENPAKTDLAGMFRCCIKFADEYRGELYTGMGVTCKYCKKPTLIFDGEKFIWNEALTLEA